MQCAKLCLWERSKSRTNTTDGKPRRYCQTRMVNPEHQEDTQWTGFLDRFHCKTDDVYNLNANAERSEITQQVQKDLFLSVQNLQFQGNIEQRRRPRTSFKYKTLPNSEKHRMFVKQPVEDIDSQDGSRSSELSDYRNVYSKYFSNNDQSRPSSGKSSIVLYSLSNKTTENKATQVDLRSSVPKRKQKFEFKTRKVLNNNIKPDVIDDIKNAGDDYIEDTKISFHKNGKRKSLTISRTESPATVQVIRVDVVCNCSSNSTMSDYEENKKKSAIKTENEEQETPMTNMKKSRLVNKYMLTNTIKTLDENVSSGKVTLMCKTFKLSRR